MTSITGDDRAVSLLMRSAGRKGVILEIGIPRRVSGLSEPYFNIAFS